MDENDVQVRERLTAVESSLKSLHRRVDHIEELVENVHEMTVEVKHMREELNGVTTEVSELKSKPAKRWDVLITALISATGSGILGFVISKLIGG